MIALIEGNGLLTEAQLGFRRKTNRKSSTGFHKKFTGSN